MKHLVTATAIILSPIAAMADGPSAIIFEPPVIPPAETWDGFYIGVSLGADHTTTTETEDIIGEACILDVKCKKYICEDVVIGTETTKTETLSASIGAHAGYRWDLGSAVIGAEAWGFATESDTFGALEAQVGYDLGGSLAYVGAFDDGMSVGIDWIVSDRGMMRVKAYSADTSGVLAGYGWAF